MSTKIYNGFRFTTADGSRPDLFALAGVVAEAITPVLEDCYRRRVAELASAVVDGCARSEIDVDDATSVCAVFAVERAMIAAAREIAATHQRNPRMDFECQVQFIEDRTSPDAVLIRLFCEQPVGEALGSVPGVVEFAYFNNVDRPERCTEAEWAKRSEVWDAAMDDRGSFGATLVWKAEELGLVQTLGDRDALVAAVPSIEARAKRLATHRALAALAPVEGESTTEMMRRATDTVKRVDADEKLIAEVAAELTELTDADLFGPTAGSS